MVLRTRRGRFHRLLHTVQPVELGQTPMGFLLAALMVLLWQTGRPALADPVNPGFSENDYFRVEWDYDLPAGTGTIRFTPDPDYLADGVILETADFTTEGLLFNSIRIGEDPAPYGVIPLDDDLYQYLLVCDLRLGNSSVDIDVTFPTVGIALRSTSLDYSGTTSAAGFPLLIWPAKMNFVSVRTIPEPPAAAALAAALAAAGVYAGRRRDG